MEQLIEKQAIQGNPQAILTLLEQDEDILYSIAYTYMKNEQDALDAMQELTYKALKKMHTVKEAKYARTWLVRVLINSCQDLLKKRIQSIAIEDTHLSEAPHYSDIQRLLETLTLTEQQLVYAKYFQQLKNHEIAQLQNIPEGTVKSRLHFVLKKLRKIAGQKEDWL